VRQVFQTQKRDRRKKLPGPLFRDGVRSDTGNLA
jgi:hypothetical protein